MSTYQEFMVLLTVALLIISILDFTHKKCGYATLVQIMTFCQGLHFFFALTYLFF